MKPPALLFTDTTDTALALADAHLEALVGA